MVTPKHIKSLDGIRAIAVLLVVFFHWGYPTLTITFGWVGVNLFFVLSGYLITNILLKDKDQYVFTSYIKTFYLKRTFRIFPLYFTFLFLMSAYVILLGVPFYTELLGKNIWLLLTFLYNYTGIINYQSYISPLQPGAHHFFGHLWSLAVEEQFYLIFPFLVYFLNKQNLKILIISIIILCPIFRIVLTEYLYSHSYAYPSILNLIYKSTFTQADALAAGAALAIFDFSKIKKPKFLFYLLLSFIILFGITSTFFLQMKGYRIAWKSLGYESPTNLSYSYFYRYSYISTLFNACFFLLILCSIKGKWVGSFLENKYMVYIGKISFGIYMFHTPILFVFKKYFIGLEKPIQMNMVMELVIFIIYILSVFIISHLSFTYFESIFLNYKSQLKITGKKILQERETLDYQRSSTENLY
jgi:peptidoglycan/LPS O-acetylase OafA/YrhL